MHTVPQVQPPQPIEAPLQRCHLGEVRRNQASSNSKMKFINVQVQGLSGAPHPALSLSLLSHAQKGKLS